MIPLEDIKKHGYTRPAVPEQFKNEIDRTFHRLIEHVYNYVVSREEV
jgi:hypothetical protein